MKTIKLIIIALLITSCSKDNEHQLPTVEVYGVEIADLDPELLVPIDAKLSQIANNIRVVPLETNPEGILSGDVYFTVGDNYILARDINGIYQFSIEGRFIRQLVSSGRGPGEILPYPIPLLIEREDLLIGAKIDGIYYYRLSSGEFLGKNEGLPVESLRSCVYTGDSTILCSYTYRRDQEPDMQGCGVKLQSLDGEVLWEIEFDYKSWTFFAADMGGIFGSNIELLSTGEPNKYLLYVSDHDTVYTFNAVDHSLYPYLLTRTEKQIIDGHPVNQGVNYCFIEEREYASVNGYLLLNMRYISNIPSNPSENRQGDRYYIIYDDNIKSAYRINVFENDYLGFFHETEGDAELLHNLPVLLPPSGKLVQRYDAYTFLQYAEEALLNPDLDASVKTRLLDLYGKISDADNPILVIGDMKESIEL